MTLLQNERERIREEELARSEVRKEMKRRRAPRLALLAMVWIAVLTALALLSSHLHH
jgi:hypothetical protein